MGTLRSSRTHRTPWSVWGPNCVGWTVDGVTHGYPAPSFGPVWTLAPEEVIARLLVACRCRLLPLPLPLPLLKMKSLFQDATEVT